MSKSRTNAAIEAPPVVETEAPLTISEAARALGKNRNTVAGWIRDGLMAYIRLPSGLPAIPRSEVTKILTILKNPMKLD